MTKNKAHLLPPFEALRKRHAAERKVLRAVAELPPNTALDVLSSVIRTLQDDDDGTVPAGNG